MCENEREREVEGVSSGRRKNCLVDMKCVLRGLFYKRVFSKWPIFLFVTAFPQLQKIAVKIRPKNMDMWLTAKSFMEVTPHCECDRKGVCANNER